MGRDNGPKLLSMSLALPKVESLKQENLRVLLVEDSEDDALLLLIELRNGGYEPQWRRVQSEQTMQQALQQEQWDIIISDYVMPGFSGLRALSVLQAKGLD